MKLFSILFLLSVLCSIPAKNLEISTELFLAPAQDPKRSVDVILKDVRTQKLFTCKILTALNATSICFLQNHYEFQSSGFRIQLTPKLSQSSRKTHRIESAIRWNFAADGPFLASGEESFYEGTYVSSTRNLLSETFSPLGISRSKIDGTIYIPAIQYSEKRIPDINIFRRSSKWNITLKITEEGKNPEVHSIVPVYHRGRFPAKNSPGEFKCRMYAQHGVTVMNFYFNQQRGKRKNGTPVLEEINLSLCFEAPPSGTEVCLADVTSCCFSGNTAYGKLPGDGGKKIRYQVFLTVK